MIEGLIIGGLIILGSIIVGIVVFGFGAGMVATSGMFAARIFRGKIDLKKLSSTIRVNPNLTKLFLLAICADIAWTGAKIIWAYFKFLIG